MLATLTVMGLMSTTTGMTTVTTTSVLPPLGTSLLYLAIKNALPLKGV